MIPDEADASLLLSHRSSHLQTEHFTITRRIYSASIGPDPVNQQQHQELLSRQVCQ